MDFSFLPNNYTIFLNNPMDKDIFITDFGYNNLAKIKPFFHVRKQSHYTLHFILNGRGELHFKGNVYSLKSHEMFFLPPDEEFRYFPSQDEPWSYIWFGFNGTRAKNIAESICFTADDPIYICKYGIKITEMLHTFMNNVYEQRNACVNFSLGAFFNLIAMLEVERLPQIKSDTASVDFYIQKIKETISLNYQNPAVTIENLCATVHLSHSYLCKIFKQASRQSIKNYLISLRMKKALELLEKGSFTVKQIAVSVGYTNELYFSKEFKKFYSISPLKYKQKFIKKSQ